MSIDLSLSRLSNLLPHFPRRYSRPTIHIAGTNGKGSVSALVSSILLHAGLRPHLKMGRFNSPHLAHITDCILIDESPVDYDDYLEARQLVIETDAKYGGEEESRLTPFEVLALTALQLLEMAQVDVAVIEVGMGGRLDATNVIPSECILVSALTSVDLDHQGFLGNTVSDIATQKAGIARSGKPFVLGPQKAGNRSEVGEAALRTVHTAGAVLADPVEVVERDWDETTDGPRNQGFSLRPSIASANFHPPAGTPVSFSMPKVSTEAIHAVLPLHGTHQLENLSTALGIIQALNTHLSSPVSSIMQLTSSRLSQVPTSLGLRSFQEGISRVNWRGRLSWHVYKSPSFTLPVLVDGAHNPASSRTLYHYINRTILSTRRSLHITYILALSHSPPKSPQDTLAPLLFSSALASPESVSIAFIPFSRPTNMPWVKSVPPLDLAKIAKKMSAQDDVPTITIWTPPSTTVGDSGETLDEGTGNGCLEEALAWAASRNEGLDGEDEHLVVVAGSLYLVADFYRLI